MEYYLLIARSVTQAQRMVRVLNGCGIRAVLFRAPTGLTNRGCSYAVRIRADDWQAAHLCLERGDLRPPALFRKEGNRYVEVKT